MGKTKHCLIHHVRLIVWCSIHLHTLQWCGRVVDKMVL
jgi:hypothetical protein